MSGARVSEADFELLGAAATAVVEADQEGLRTAKKALMENKDVAVPAVLVVEGELRSDADEDVDCCWEYSVDGRPLCFILDETAVPEIQGDDASYGRVTLSITFHEREDRNA